MTSLNKNALDKIKERKTYIAEITEDYDREKPIAMDIKSIHGLYLVCVTILVYLSFLFSL